MSMIDTTSTEWLQGALCAEVDPSLFVTDDDGGGTFAAKRLCSLCELRPACLTWAMDVEKREGSMAGVFGGKSQIERKRIRRAAA